MIVAVVCALIIFTPVKEYLPGYEGIKLKKEVIDMKLTLDSLDRERGGGVLNELSHEIDLASFIIGRIEDVKLID